MTAVSVRAGAVAILLSVLAACTTPPARDAPASAPETSTSDVTSDATGDVTAKGARALVRDPRAARWQLIAAPQRAVTTSGELTPSPDAAPQDRGIAYDRGCQAAPEATAVPSDPCVLGDPDGEVEVVVLGDSKMLQWLPAIEPIARVEGWRVTILTKSACGLTLTGQYSACVTYNRALLRDLSRPGHVPDLVLTSLGDDSTGPLARDLAANLERLQSAGARIAPFADNPAADRVRTKDNPGTVLTCVLAHRTDWSSCAYPRNDGRGTAALRQAAAGLDDVEVITVNRWICPTQRCPAAIGGVLVYREGTHLTATYVATLAPVLHRALIDAGHASADPLH